MQPRVRGAAQAVYDLLAPGFNELRPGDTLGVWTFNDTLYAGQFPLQDFSPQNQLHVAEQVASYLQSRRYEKEPNLDKALLAVQRIVKNSDFLTVIFVTTGNEEFHGTPYDKSINESFKKWRSPQQQAHMPLLTILRCEHGSFTGFVVNQAPWPVEMPPLPAELQRSAIAKRETPASIQATAAAALAAATKPQQPAPPPAATPEPTPQIPKPAPIPVQTAANTAAPSPVEQSAAPLAAAPVEIVKPALQAPVTQPIKVAPQTPAKSLPAPFRQIVTTTNTVRRVAASTPTNAPKQLAAASTPKTSPQARAAQRTNSAAATWPEPPAPSTTGPARPLFSIAIPWREWFSPRNLCIAGGSVVGIGLLTLAFKLRARARKPFHISLITHSVEKE